MILFYFSLVDIINSDNIALINWLEEIKRKIKDKVKKIKEKEQIWAASSS